MKTVAVDPGYGRAGFAVVSKENGHITLIHSECLETEKEVSDEGRMLCVGERLRNIIKTHSPEHMAIETLFFSRNKKTVMRVSEIRGVCIYVAKKNNLKISEYAPKQVKSAITGYGNADKKHIMRMVPHLIHLDKDVKRHDDEYDAIAIGITHLLSPHTTR